MAKALTARGVEAAKPGASRREVPDGALPGLYLVIQPSGAKSWAVRYRASGRTRKMTLGRVPVLGLADARAKARESLAAVDRGEDPAAAAKAEPDRDLVSTVVADFLARHAAKNRTASETKRIFDREVLPLWGDRRIHEVSKRDVIELVDKIVDRGAPTMASRTLAQVRKLFNWAVSRDVIASSPAAGVSPPQAQVKRERVLTDAEIAALWRASERLRWPWGPYVRLLLLTAARREEVAGMRWRELRGDVWVIPSERSKNGREHHLPLGSDARAILDGLPRVSDDLVFTTTGRTPVSGFSKAKSRLDALMADELGEEFKGWRVHDLRRTAATGMARAGYRKEVADKVLNHTSGSFGGVAGVYARHTYAAEMREAVEGWEALLKQIANGDGEASSSRSK